MAVHYERGLIGRIRDAGLTPVTIAIGGDIQWQGGVTVSEQLQLLAFLQDMEKKHPIDSLPEAKKRTAKKPDDGTTGSGQSAGTQSTGTQSASANGTTTSTPHHQAGKQHTSKGK